MELIPINKAYSIEFIWNDDTVFARIWFFESPSPSISTRKQIGTIVIYYDSTPDEIVFPHWQGDCYITADHFDEKLVGEMFEFLQNNTKCVAPFALQVNKGERIGGTGRMSGKLFSFDD